VCEFDIFVVILQEILQVSFASLLPQHGLPEKKRERKSHFCAPSAAARPARNYQKFREQALSLQDTTARIAYI
jgi:hypothetical protein